MRIENDRAGVAFSQRLKAVAWGVAVLGALSLGGPCPAGAAAAVEMSQEQHRDFIGLSQNAAATGEAPEVWLDDANGTPRLLRLGVPIRAEGARRGEDRSEERARVARQFVSEHRALFKLTDPDAELELVKAEVDEVSLSHLRFQQRYRGVPVWSKQVIVHLDAKGYVYLVQGDYAPTPDGLDTVPRITAAAAVQSSRGALGVGDAPLSNEPTVDLVIFEGEGGGARLAYKVWISSRPDNSWTYFIDAETGGVLERLTNVRSGETVEANGPDLWDQPQTFRAWQAADDKFFLLDPTIPLPDPPAYDPLDPLDPTTAKGDLKVFDAGNKEDEDAETYVVSTSASGPWDAAGVSLMTHLVTVNEYYQNTFGRVGADGEGKHIVAAVHYGVDYNNAFWNGKRLSFGDGDGKALTKLAGCLDIVAHEFTHGIIQYTADLVYAKQSGALNESYCDFFGAMIDRDDWTIGEGCVVEEPGFMRDMADPHRSRRRQPSKMSEYKNLPNTEEGDWGGVHTNSGIPNRAGYLLAARLGNEKAEKIVFKALTDYLTPGAKFLDARNAWTQAAEDLYLPGSPEVAATKAAWEAVEVRDIAALGKVWGGAGSGGDTVASCFVSTAAGRGPALRLPLVLAAAGIVVAVRRRGGSRRDVG